MSVAYEHDIGNDFSEREIIIINRNEKVKQLISSFLEDKPMDSKIDILNKSISILTQDYFSRLNLTKSEKIEYIALIDRLTSIKNDLHSIDQTAIIVASQKLAKKSQSAFS